MTAKQKRSVRGGIAGNDDVIFIGRIPRGATQGAMKQFLQTIVEDVTKVRFVIDPRTRHHRGYGFARFGSAESAAKVLKMAKTREGLVFCGKRLNAGHSSMTDDSASDGSEPADQAGRATAYGVREVAAAGLTLKDVLQPLASSNAVAPVLGQTSPQPVLQYVMVPSVPPAATCAAPVFVLAQPQLFVAGGVLKS